MNNTTSVDDLNAPHSFAKHMKYVVIATALVLLVPLVAMQFTNEVTWSVGDFIIAGALLVGAGFVYNLVARKMSNPRNRLILGVAVVFGLLLVWAELAVGIIGS